MSKIYEIEIQGERILYEIDSENMIARCITESNSNPELCHADEVEDTSSWEEIDYSEALRDIEGGNILSEAGSECEETRMVYVSEEINERSGVCEYKNFTFDRDEAIRRTNDDYQHLSAFDRKNSRYGVEGFEVDILPGDTAKEAFDRMCNDIGGVAPDPDFYVEVK